MKNGSRLLAVAGLLMLSLASFAQATTSNYDQHETIAPVFYPAYGDLVRTASGTHGPGYRQNREDNKISA